MTYHQIAAKITLIKFYEIGIKQSSE